MRNRIIIINCYQKRKGHIRALSFFGLILDENLDFGRSSLSLQHPDNPGGNRYFQHRGNKQQRDRNKKDRAHKKQQQLSVLPFSFEPQISHFTFPPPFPEGLVARKPVVRILLL